MSCHSLPMKIEQYANGLPEGTPIRAKALRMLGARAAVDQALTRLTRQGRLLRVGRGLYVRPVTTRFGAQSPYADQVVEQLRQTTGETIVSNGAVAANALHLTTQVPMQLGFLTSGSTRTLRVGPETVVLRKAKAWQLVAPNSIVGDGVRALAWIGEAGAPEALARLAPQLTPQQRQQMQLASIEGPQWLSAAVAQAFGGV